MKDTRTIYLVTGADGKTVITAAWGVNAEDAIRKVSGGVMAHPTAWRRVPLLINGGAVTGDVVECEGVCYMLSDAGRPAPGAVEPLEPDAEVVDEVVLAGAAERMGHPIEIVERGTLRRLRFEPRKKVGAR